MKGTLSMKWETWEVTTKKWNFNFIFVLKFQIHLLCCGFILVSLISGQIWEHLDISDWQFNISNSYLDPLNNIDIKSKEQFNKLVFPEYKQIIFKPDIYITETLETFINDTDNVLDTAISQKGTSLLK